MQQNFESIAGELVFSLDGGFKETKTYTDNVAAISVMIYWSVLLRSFCRNVGQSNITSVSNP